MRLLLADDHNLIREGIRVLLERLPDLKVVGEAADGQSAVRMARELKPDLAILDITMPELNGIEATRQIKAQLPDCKVILLSMHANTDMIGDALRAGANGYLTKNCLGQELLLAVQTVGLNQTYLSPQAAGLLTEAYTGRVRTSPGAKAKALTPRQCEILQLLAEGHSTRQISKRISRSVKTVEMHRLHVMQKMGFDSLADLTKYAIRNGLASLEAE
jgi:DNA-binding NarL/FixJ family response regulator